MTFGEYMNLHPLERDALLVFANRYETHRQEFIVDVANEFLKSLDG